MAEAEVITMASGGFSEIQAQELMTTNDMLAVMKSAGAKAAKYAAPNKK